jgi:hypothetical protein
LLEVVFASSFRLIMYVILIPAGISVATVGRK